MAENREGGFEKKDAAEPHTLDLVKIDNRWAQVLSQTLIKFLDDGSAMNIDFGDYEMVRSFRGFPLNMMESEFGEKISEKELQNVHWGPEQKDYPYLKGEVEVFGEYVKK